MVLTNEAPIGKLQPEVPTLPANDSPSCLGSESMAPGVGKPGKRWQPSAIWPRSGERSPTSPHSSELGPFAHRQRSARQDGDVWPEGQQGLLAD